MRASQLSGSLDAGGPLGCPWKPNGVSRGTGEVKRTADVAWPASAPAWGRLWGGTLRGCPYVDGRAVAAVPASAPAWGRVR